LFEVEDLLRASSLDGLLLPDVLVMIVECVCSAVVFEVVILSEYGVGVLVLVAWR